MVNFSDAISVNRGACHGFSLIELMLAVGLSALLLLGLVQMISAAGSSVRLQDNHAQLQENGRLALSALTRAIRETGFDPRPWTNEFAPVALGDDTRDGVTATSDRLSVRSWSDRNCFDNLNPIRDALDKPVFFIRESTFDLNSQNNLAYRCRYGPSLSEMDTQIRREGLVPGVESFQVQFGEDSDGDGSINRWVRAGRWSDPTLLLGVKIGLLLSSSEPVLEAASGEFEVLDQTLRKRADGKMRSVVQFAVSFRGRSG
jgi:type IV pilus assembly protein PilW